MKNDKNKKDLVNRISYVEGHCRAIKQMIQDDKYCIDIIFQVGAVEAALKKIREKILEDHLSSCVTTAIKGDSEKERKRVLSELMEVYKKKNT